MFISGNYFQLMNEYHSFYAAKKHERAVKESTSLSGTLGWFLLIVLFGVIIAVFQGRFSMFLLEFILIFTAVIFVWEAVKHFYSRKRWKETDKMVNGAGTVKYSCEVDDLGYVTRPLRGGKTRPGRKMVYKFSYIKNNELIYDMCVLSMAVGTDHMREVYITVYETRYGEKVIEILTYAGCYRITGN